MTPSRFFSIVLGILAALASCQRPQGPKKAENQVGIVVGSLYLTLQTDKISYRAGEPIKLLLKLNNRSERDTTLQFSSGQRYDFQIVNESGETAWTWSADRSFTQALSSETLAADGALEYREEVATPLPPGRYAVSGSITTMGAPVTARTVITIR